MHERLDTELRGDRVPVCDIALELRKAVTDFVASTAGKGQTKMPLLLALMLVVNPHAALHAISLTAMTCTEYLTRLLEALTQPSWLHVSFSCMLIMLQLLTVVDLAR